MRRIVRIAAFCTMAAGILALPALGRQGLEGHVGVKLCSACHKNTHADIVAAQPKTDHAFALWAVGEQGGERKVVGDFASAPGFSQQQVAQVLGRGSRHQAYLDADLRVLPGEWNVHEAKWQALASEDAKQSCLGCHTTGYDVAKGEWSEAGVTCEACHGAGANHAKSSDKKATIVRPQTLAPERRAMICGRCHARGKNPQGLPFAASYKPGDDLGQHFTLDGAWEPGARYSQYNDLVSGKHLAQGVTCDTCHDPHGVAAGQAHQLRKAADELCLDCHKPPLPGTQHDPPQDCARCHMVQGSHQFEKPKTVAPGTPHWH